MLRNIAMSTPAFRSGVSELDCGCTAGQARPQMETFAEWPALWRSCPMRPCRRSQSVHLTGRQIVWACSAAQRWISVCALALSHACSRCEGLQQPPLHERGEHLGGLHAPCSLRAPADMQVLEGTSGGTCHFFPLLMLVASHDSCDALRSA